MEVFKIGCFSVKKKALVLIGEMGVYIFTNSWITWKNQSESGRIGVEVFTNIKLCKFVADLSTIWTFELQGKMSRLNRLTSIDFSAQSGLKATFSDLTMHHAGRIHVEGCGD